VKEMKKLIVILGDLASGKSTLADRLKEENHFLCFKKDQYKEMLCDKLGFSNREENLRISHLTMDTILFSCEVAMGSDIDIILEANFHASELKSLQALIKKHQYRAIFLCLTADTQILFERFKSRVPTRHPAHLSMGLHRDFAAFSHYINVGRKEVKGLAYHLFDTSHISDDELLIRARELLQKEGF